MATDHSADHHSSAHGDDGAGPLNHETTDISVDGVGKVLIAFAVAMVVVTAAMYWSYRTFDRWEVARDVPVTPMAPRPDAVGGARPPLANTLNDMEQLGRQPAGPKLLTNEPAWLDQVRADQRDALNTYGWVDKTAGTVRIPIDRAKQLIVERGLPSTPPQVATSPDP